MFSAIRQGTPFYILEKGENPVLKIGQVQSVSTPAPKYSGTPPAFGAPVETTVDVTVKVGDETMDFKQLPSNLSIANFGSNGVVVSESREAMDAEAEVMFNNSSSILDSMEYHRHAVQGYKEIRRQLNPQLAKEQQQAEKIGALETKMDRIESSLDGMMELLNKALNRKQN